MSAQTCHGCQGKGWIVVKHIVNGVFGADVLELPKKCPVCEGKGKVPANAQQ